MCSTCREFHHVSFPCVTIVTAQSANSNDGLRQFTIELNPTRTTIKSLSLALLPLANCLIMATIIDALAKLRLRGYVRSSPSPQDDESRPQYVSARRRYKSGRKGRISVYRVVDDHIDNRGRRVKTYANVEGGDLDCDERESFIGIEKKKNIKRGQSVRHKKNRTSQEGDTPKKDEPQVKRPPIKSVSRGRRLERGT
jgi:hypothetical protein